VGAVVVKVELLIVGIVAVVLLGYWLAHFAVGLLPLLLLVAVLTGVNIVLVNRR
jgi:hypothetical protein